LRWIDRVYPEPFGYAQEKLRRRAHHRFWILDKGSQTNEQRISPSIFIVCIRQSKTCTEPRRSIGNRKSKIGGALSNRFHVRLWWGCGSGAADRENLPHRFLDSSTASGMAVLFEAFWQEMRKLGWIQGKNIAVEYRFAEGKNDRLPELAAELVRLKVDLIVVSSGERQI